MVLPTLPASRYTLRVIRVWVPATGSTSQSRVANTASVPSNVACSETTGLPTRVAAALGENVQRATPGSLPDAVERQPLVVPGKPPLAMGSTAKASGPATAALL